MAAELVLFTLLGLGTGAVYAGLGVALVATYRSSRVVNFAQGAIAMWGAFVYLGLRSSGTLYLPLVGLPSAVRLGGPAPIWVALLGAVVSTVVVSLVAYLVVFLPLRKAPDLSKVIASVGVMMVVEAIATVQFGSQEAVVPSFFPAGSLKVLGKPVPIDLLAISASVSVLAALVWAYFSHTRAGWATTAATESERDLALLGWRPATVEALAWAVSGAVSGLVGVLVAPMIGVDTVDYTLFVVPALAVALAGRLSSLPVACVAGFILGILQSEIAYLATMSWFPSWASTGAGEALPLIAIVAILSFGGRRWPRVVDPSAKIQVARPRATLPGLAGLAVIGVLALLLTSGTTRFGVIESLAAVPIMVSFVVLTGMTGQISLAQVTLAGIAALVLSKLAALASLPFPVPVVLGTAAAVAVGLVVALPALRIRGTQLAIVTIALAVAVQEFVFSNPSIVSGTVNLIAPASFPGLDLAARQGSDVARLDFGILALLVALVASAVALNLGRSAMGLRLLAVRASEPAAASLGVDVTGAKLMSFGLSAGLAGLGGCMVGYSFGQFSEGAFDVLAAGLPFLAFAYLGGISSVAGAVVAATLVPGGIVVALLSGVGTALGEYYLLASGLVLVVAAISYPQGMAGAVHRLVAARRPPQPVWEGGSGTGWQPGRGALGPRPGASLSVAGLRVAYGGTLALDGVAMEISAGSVLGLIGANGAGKTSLIDAVTGFTPARGSVRYCGDEILGLPPHRLARLGIVRTWQTPVPLGELALWEEMVVAGDRLRPFGVARDVLRPVATRRLRGTAQLVLSQMGIEDLAGKSSSELSAGQLRLAGIARTLMARPTVLLLDEPAAGLDPSESRQLARRVRQLAGSGLAVLVVDHDMEFVFGSCDRVVVLDLGRVVTEGSPEVVRASAELRSAYLGPASSMGRDPGPAVA